jgi:hypothetical protein
MQRGDHFRIVDVRIKAKHLARDLLRLAELDLRIERAENTLNVTSTEIVVNILDEGHIFFRHSNVITPGVNADLSCNAPLSAIPFPAGRKKRLNGSSTTVMNKMKNQAGHLCSGVLICIFS